MAGIRSAFSLFRTFAAAPPKQNLPRFGFVACAMAVRNISTIEVTKNITLISNDKKNGKVVDLKLEVPEKKPLVVMLSWLMARKKHIIKYADLYLKRGYDVVNISISPWQLLWPVKGTQLVAREVVQFLDRNPTYGPLYVHGFSVGGYVWAEVLVHLDADRERYRHILERFAGQVWDSMADITEIPDGMPFAVFPDNKIVQKILKSYILFHMKVFDSVATRHYLKARDTFHTDILTAPMLFFVSKTDPIGTVRSNWKCKETMESLGAEVVAADVLKFLEANVAYGPMVIHGFSVGGYLWSEAMVQMNVEQERYQHIVDKFIGQIWDSTADVTEIPEGLPVAVFPRNKVMQAALKQYIIYHLKTFDKVATRHYVRASQIFHTNVVKAPALFFISKSDSIGAEKSNLRARDNWSSNGIETHWKVWESTPHVGHFRHYPEEYKAELKTFLDKVENQTVTKQASQTVQAARAKN